MVPSILIVEDEDSLRKALERFFLKKKYEVSVANRGEEGVDLLRKQNFDLLLVDLMLPQMSGIDVIRQSQQMPSIPASIVMTGYGTIPSAVEAIKSGAFHYITKPFELDDLFTLSSKALEHHQLKEENRALKEVLHSKFSMQNIIGTSPKMREVFSLVERVAASESTILILGESGTGKELLAKAIHYKSRRAERPLVTVNCAAIPETLLESELFGHLRGAFTGAVGNFMGRFEQADGGTIFLDEIGDMSPHLQVKVLRVLQDKKIQPLGSTRLKETDVRIITATNRNLEQEVKEGHFREDLYFRLNVIPIVLPPLRERTEDIPLLIEHFIKKSNLQNKKSVTGAVPAAMERLVRYDWPGNIRELENLVERLVVLKGKGEIIPEDIAPVLMFQKDPRLIFDSLTIPDNGLSFREFMGDFEWTLIRKALERCGGNKNRAATLLGLNRTTLIEKLKKRGYGGFKGEESA